MYDLRFVVVKVKQDFVVSKSFAIPNMIQDGEIFGGVNEDN